MNSNSISKGLLPVSLYDNNSVELNLWNQTTTGQSYGTYYLWVGSPLNEFFIVVPFEAVGGSNFTGYSNSGSMIPTSVYEIGAMEGSVQLSGLGDSTAATIIKPGGAFQGINATQGSFSSAYWGEAKWLELGIDSALTVAGVFFPEIGLPLAALSEMDSFAGYFGAYDYGSSGVTDTSNMNATQTANPHIVVWAATKGGSFNLNGCKGAPYDSTCGKNVFAEAFTVQSEFANVALVTAGTMVASATNQVWAGSLPSIAVPQPFNGAQATLSYLIEPAISFGGYTYINTPTGNVAAAGTQVTLQQNCAGTATDFVVTSNATGYWHFFGNPTCTYTYSASWTGLWDQDTFALSASGSIPGETEGQDEGVNIIMGYQVSFSETGLPEWTQWSLTFHSVLGSTNTNSLLFLSDPGVNLPYTVGSVSCYSSSPPSGTVTVTNSWVNVPTVSFSKTCSYSLTIKESGLPSKYSWTADAGGTQVTAPAGSTSLVIPGLTGTNNWTVSTVIVSVTCSGTTCTAQEYLPSPAGGTVTGAASVTVTFTLTTKVYRE